MRTSIKIALSIPNHNKPDRSFSLRLKQGNYNEPCEYNKPPKLFALSDIEGNFMTFLNLLISAKVIDKYLSWTFEDGHLVIVGDCFDRGEEVVECLWLIYSLEEKARKRGGYVHFILGNHEIMNMNGDWRYVHPKYAQSTKTPYTALYYGNSELWHWLCTKNIIEKVGDILFVHGGISKQLLNMNLSASEINDRVRPYYDRATAEFTDPLLNIVFNTEFSPFWYRGYYQSEINEDFINETLSHFGVNKIVTGHTMMNRITSLYNGKVINIDTDHASESSEALFISRDKSYRMKRFGKKEKLK